MASFSVLVFFFVFLKQIFAGPVDVDVVLHRSKRNACTLKPEFHLEYQSFCLQATTALECYQALYCDWSGPALSGCVVAEGLDYSFQAFCDGKSQQECTDWQHCTWSEGEAASLPCQAIEGYEQYTAQCGYQYENAVDCESFPFCRWTGNLQEAFACSPNPGFEAYKSYCDSFLTNQVKCLDYGEYCQWNEALGVESEEEEIVFGDCVLKEGNPRQYGQFCVDLFTASSCNSNGYCTWEGAEVTGCAVKEGVDPVFAAFCETLRYEDCTLDYCQWTDDLLTDPGTCTVKTGSEDYKIFCVVNFGNQEGCLDHPDYCIWNEGAIAELTPCQCSDWIAGECSQSCGEGTQTNVRTCTEGTNGLTCAQQNMESTEVVSCLTQECPIDCACGDFSPGTCSTTCGVAGVAVNTRTCVEAQFGGQTCAALGLSETEEVPCNNDPCPIDCSCGAVTLGTCSVTCGEGTQTNTRVCNEAQFGGQSCAELDLFAEEVVGCSPGNCPVDCSCGDFTPGTCSVSCEAGIQENTRVCTPAQHGGQSCQDLGLESSEFVPCNLGLCPIDCQCPPWQEGTCSTTCGPGTKTDTRVCTEAVGDGQTCAQLGLENSQVVDCNTGPCPVDCVCDEVFQDGTCSVTCGDGTQTNTRSCVEGSNGGATCAELGLSTSELESCNLGACPVDCTCGDWTEGTCSVSCSDGTQQNTRVCTEGANGGQSCAAMGLHAIETVSCNPGNCPVHCYCDDWVDGSCSTTCGIGTQINTRTCHEAQHGGDTCAEQGLETTFEKSCNLGDCPTDCTCGDFTEGTCSTTCGPGSRTNTRTCVEGTNGGATCADLGLSASEQESCNLGECPVDCTCDENFTDGTCSVSCGDGSQVNTRSCVEATFGGQTCAELGLETSETIPCNLGGCPVDCACDETFVPGTCSVTCGSGTQINTRTCTEAINGGQTCEQLGLAASETVVCTPGECPVDCVCDEVFNQGQCSVTCGDGSQTNTRTCTEALYGGQTCAELGLSTEEIVPCNVVECPVDCTCDATFVQGQCSTTCGEGTRVNTRECVEATFGGQTCEQLSLFTKEDEDCNLGPCPIDCACGDWVIGQCSKSCDAGSQIDTRQCVEALYGGQTCAALGLSSSRNLVCNLGACPTCTDGIQNRDETDVDCGGSFCDPCCSVQAGVHAEFAIYCDAITRADCIPEYCTTQGVESGIACVGYAGGEQFTRECAQYNNNEAACTSNPNCAYGQVYDGTQRCTVKEGDAYAPFGSICTAYLTDMGSCMDYAAYCNWG